MRLPINIEELLGGRAVEGDRIDIRRTESQRLTQSDHRDGRGTDIFPDRHSLPSGVCER